MEEDASRRGHIELLEDLGVEQRERDHLLELLDVCERVAPRRHRQVS